MTILYNEISKAALKMQLNLSLTYNTIFKGSMSYESSLQDYTKLFKKYATDNLGIQSDITLQKIYDKYNLLNKSNNYNNNDKLIIIIIFVYKFYSNNLVNKQYYSLWKNKDISEPLDICKYKYYLYEINRLWSNYLSSSRMDDYEKIINVYINPTLDEDKKKIDEIFNTLIQNINNPDTDLDETKKMFEDEIFNVPNPNCNDIKFNYSYFILVILYYIHYTISPNEIKGNNILEDMIPISYDNYITSKENEHCSTEKSFIDAYNTSKSFKPNMKSLPKGIPKGLSLPKGLPKGLSLPKGLPSSEGLSLPKGLPKGLSLPKGLPSSEGLTNPLAASIGKVSAGLLPQK